MLPGSASKVLEAILPLMQVEALFGAQAETCFK